MTGLVLIALSFTSRVTSQDTSIYLKKVWIQGNDSLPYRLLLPENYDSKKQYPFILFLHGAGERGNDNLKQLIHGGNLFIRDSIRKNFPAIVVFPQCAGNSFWSNVQFRFDSATQTRSFNFQQAGTPTRSMEMTINLLNKLLAEMPVKKDQVYVGGLSMGGMGTFEIVGRMPGTFAAAFPICGGGNPQTAPRLAKTAWWVFHGQKDPVVPIKLSSDMVAALRQQNARVSFTIYPDALHNSWDDAFKEPGLLEWIFSHKLVP